MIDCPCVVGYFSFASLLGNIAWDKPAIQSSDEPGGDAWRGRHIGYGCSKTKKGTGEWWRVDFGSPHLVYNLKITSRKDCCPGFLSDFDVRVGNIHNNPKANAL